MNSTTKQTIFPACSIEIPPCGEQRGAAFYLAAEEFVARRLPPDNYLFTWQVAPTVVMGRNQVPHQEINLDFCHAEHIDICRRKSGGGCIFADGNNIMISLVTTEGSVEPIFASYAENVARVLNELGAGVEVSGRNDIVLTGGGKICGNAFYHLPDRNIVHGTMLYDTDFRLMNGALTPDAAKLKAAGVSSVRSRVSLLKDRLNIDVRTLRSELEARLCNRSIVLSEADVSAINAIEATYHEPSYLYGQSIRTGQLLTARIEGCGRIELRLALKGSLISDIFLAGDFFEEGSATLAFKEAFVGVAYTREQVREAIERHHPECHIRRLDADAALRLFFPEKEERPS